MKLNVYSGMMALVLTLALSYSMAHAVGTPEQIEKCTPDVMRLCSADVPDVKKITACMHAKRSQISAACRATEHKHR
jgi:hypothetical protein